MIEHVAVTYRALNEDAAFDPHGAKLIAEGNVSFRKIRRLVYRGDSLGDELCHKERAICDPLIVLPFDVSADLIQVI
jgi:hypothetical protein